MKLTYDFKGPKLKHIVRFELVSLLGRTLFKNRTIIKKRNNALYLDVGAGENYKEGWTHVDFFCLPSLKFWVNRNKRSIPNIQMDLRYPFNCEDSIVDGIYSGHTLEHLWPNEAINLLREFYRILKPGCWLRINVPDLEIYIDFYNGKQVHEQFKVYRTGCEAISFITQNYGHHSSWDKNLLKLVLEEVGFINVNKVEFGKTGSDSFLIKEEEVRKWETLVLEAQKPTI